MSMRVAALAVLLATAPAFAQTAPAPETVVQRVMEHAKYKEAIAVLKRDHDRLVEENIRLTEIPAPPFKEQAKGKAYLELMRQHALTDVHMDEEGNVLGIRKGSGDGPLLAVVAHLDTVFPEGTNVTVKRDGTKLRAPGIADDTRGLAVMLALIRAMDAAKMETESDILFVASVGEEGLGDLRGVKHLFLKGPFKDRIKTFIALDGVNPGRVMTTALGSRRFRVTFSGPGGHSYLAFGTVNPMYAMGQFLTEFAKIPAPELTTHNVGVVNGGTSVNSIPLSVAMEVDIRSVAPEEVAKIEARMKEIAAAAAAAENAARSTKNGKIEVKVDVIGDRPAGSIQNPLLGLRQPNRPPEAFARDRQLAQFAWEAATAHGFKPVLETSSTDANIPMKLGIPAITIAAGVGDRMHSLDEWLDADPEVGVRQLGMAMTTILAAAGLR